MDVTHVDSKVDEEGVATHNGESDGVEDKGGNTKVVGVDGNEHIPTEDGVVDSKGEHVAGRGVGIGGDETKVEAPEVIEGLVADIMGRGIGDGIIENAEGVGALMSARFVLLYIFMFAFRC